MSINKFREVIARSWNEGAPIGAHLELTFRCNLDCSFCYNEKIFGGELSTEEIFRTLENLAELGVLTLNLSGGEPLVRRDLRAIIEHAQSLGFSVKIYTNGVLIDDDWARYFAATGIFGLEVSIHGDDPESMDRTTRVPGSFTMLMAALTRLKREGVKVVLKTPVTRHNLHRLVNIKKIADGFDYPVFFDAKITPRDDGDQGPVEEDGMTAEQGLHYWTVIAPQLGGSAHNAPKPDAVHDLVKPICGTGSAHIVVDPFGNVLPCVAWRRSLGNVREKPLREIWFGTGAQDIRQMAINAVAITQADPAGAFAFYCLARVHQAADPDRAEADTFADAAIRKNAYDQLVQLTPAAPRGVGAEPATDAYRKILT